MRAVHPHLGRLLEDDAITSVSVGVWQKGHHYTVHLGELDPGAGNRPTDHTLYEIASVSKTFTGLLLARALLEGGLSLDEEVRSLLGEGFSGLEHEGNPVRVEHLATHTSGLPHFLPLTIGALFDELTGDELAYAVDEVRRNYSKEEFLSDLAGLEIDVTPGTRFGYSNVNTELMAYLLERHHGRPYSHLFRALCRELGLKNTTLDLDATTRALMAPAYGVEGRALPHFESRLWRGSASVKTTLPDLVRTMEVYLSDENEAARRALQTVRRIGDREMGILWPIRHSEVDGTYYEHHGGSYGTQAWVFLIPKHELGLAILTNQGAPETAGKLLRVTNAILDDLR